MIADSEELEVAGGRGSTCGISRRIRLQRAKLGMMWAAASVSWLLVGRAVDASKNIAQVSPRNCLVFTMFLLCGERFVCRA